MNFKVLSKLEFSNQLVLTTKQLAEFYGCTTDRITQNFNSNKERFTEGKHYFKVTGADLQNLRIAFGTVQFLPKVRVIYLWTKRGAALHAKMLSTDKAWEVYEMLEDAYFNQQNKTETVQNAQTESEPNQNDQTKISVQPQNSQNAQENFGHTQRFCTQNSQTQTQNSQMQPQIQTDIQETINPNLRIAFALQDIEASIKVAKKIFNLPKENLLISCKEAAEKYYGVDLSSFDILISAESEEFILTPIDD